MANSKAKSKSNPNKAHIEKVSNIQKAILNLTSELGPEAEEIAELTRKFRHKLRTGVEEIIKTAEGANYKLSTKKNSKGGLQFVSADEAYVIRKTVTARKKASVSKLTVLQEFDRVAEKQGIIDQVIANGTRAILRKKSWSSTEVDQLLKGTEDNPEWKTYRNLVKTSMVEDSPTINYSVFARNEDGKDVLIDLSGFDYLDYVEE